MADWNETIQSMNKTDELMAEITRLRDENVKLKSQIVMECNEDEVPTFNQGLIEHELLEVVTAKRLDTLVALVVSLRARLAEAEAAKADAWDEAMKAAAKRADEGFYQSCCGKGTIHGCCGSPDMFWENPEEIAAAIRDIVNPYRSKSHD